VTFVYKRPTVRVKIGLSLILLSYVICWPAIGVLGAISLYTEEPMILIVGGPIMYGVSHLMFLIGIYFAGRDYALASLKRVKNSWRKENE
jgi:hypothetical protein